MKALLRRKRVKKFIKKIEITAEEIESAKYNPIVIGQKVLEQFGYKVDLQPFAHNSLRIDVIDKEGKEMCEELIGQ